MLLWILIAGLILAADQVTKFLVVQHIGPYSSITVWDNILQFVYVRNTGAAFSIFENMTWLLGIVSVLFCIVIVVYAVKKRPSDRLLCIALTMMFAGALGNAIDRIFRMYVVDFIKVMFVNFPVFNIADIAITIGAALFILYIIRSDKKENV